MKKNTIGYWLNTIQDAVTRGSAIKYATFCGSIDCYCKSKELALKQAFIWEDTHEGDLFWDGLHEKILKEAGRVGKLEITNMTALTLINAKIINAGGNKLYLDNGTEIELSPEEIDHLNTCADSDYITGFTPVVNEEHVTDMDEQMPFLKAVLDDENISDEFKNAISQQKF